MTGFSVIWLFLIPKYLFTEKRLKIAVLCFLTVYAVFQAFWAEKAELWNGCTRIVQF